jgi:hypothetical protein
MEGIPEWHTYCSSIGVFKEEYWRNAKGIAGLP